jgi:methylenetetrahydrofolate dehydrogenase (NADP+) / methenyltetrahydrofolate cyclohydrolase
VDCGINTTADGIVGDVEFGLVRPVVRAITPVPGGVGPVTTMILLEQTVQAAERAVGSADPMAARFDVTRRGSGTTSAS